MLKKIIIALLLIIPNTVFITNTYCDNMPSINWIWLPWYQGNDILTPAEWDISTNNSLEWIWNIVWELIKYISVVAVISVMLSWIMYMISWGEEEKIKKAKNWIIWSLVWVFLSISAWWIINIINAITI